MGVRSVSRAEPLFNLHRAAAEAGNSVAVVEGFFDCMKVHQAGIRSVVALMGSALYEPQQQLLRERFRQIHLLLDGDSAGRKASEVIAQKLRRYCSVQVIPLAEGVQPDQMSEQDIVDALQRLANDDYGFGNISK